MTDEADRKFEVRKKVDSDWKRKVQLEKAKLAAQIAGAAPKAEPPKAAAPSPKPEEPSRPKELKGMDLGFMTLVQQLADQAAIMLGLVPGYEKNCEQAAMAIEMLRALQDKTKGNLGPEEAKALSTVVYELQMRYVQSCGNPAA